MSVKDQGVGTREQELNVLHAGVYGPSKSSSLSSTYVWFKPTASLAGLGEKLRRVPRTTQPG
jgi:hypothetical protein